MTDSSASDAPAPQSPSAGAGIAKPGALEPEDDGALPALATDHAALEEEQQHPPLDLAPHSAYAPSSALSAEEQETSSLYASSLDGSGAGAPPPAPPSAMLYDDTAAAAAAAAGATTTSRPPSSGGGSSSGLAADAGAAAASEAADAGPATPPSPMPVSPTVWAAQAAAANVGAAGSEGGLLDLRRHAKHVFVFSSAGKPVFSLHGDESQLAGLMATAQAIMSVVQSGGQALKHLRSGRHVVAFLDRSPLYLVGFSALGEPPAVLRMQLSLVHGQLVSLLTGSALTSLFKRSPGYDLRKLLGGAEVMLRQLIAGFSNSPGAALGAFASLPLAPPIRGMASAALSTAVRESNSLFGFLLGGSQVLAAAASPSSSPPLQPWDVLLLQNFLLSSPAFLHAEAFTPFCLPHYNPAANLHAYVHYLHAPSRTAVVLLCGSPPDFHCLSAARRRMQRDLQSAGTLQALQAAVASSASGGGPLSISSLPKQVGGGTIGTTPLLHFAYRLPAKNQFVMSPWGAPLDTPSLQQAVVVAYSQLRASMFEPAGERLSAGGPLQRLRYEARSRFVLLASATSDAELYLTLDPLADKHTAVSLHERLGAWLRARHEELFL